MSKGITYLHSHSTIEREKKLPKHFVLVDEEYAGLFQKPHPFEYKRKMYMKVDILDFVNNGGVFKNFEE
jgi:hypothetical protein